MSTAVANGAATKDRAATIIETQRDKLCALIPPGVITPERFMGMAIALAKSPDLIKRCTPDSLVLSIVGAARLGLELDPSLGHCYIVPRKNVATLQVGYRGFVELANRSKAIAAIHAEVVREGDDYRVLYGTSRGIHHERDENGDGKVKGAYCTWRDLRSGTVEFHPINLARIERAKRASAAGDSGPWRSDPEAMIRKTAVRDAAKLWPMTPELAQAVHWDEEDERGERQSIPLPGKALPAPTDGGEQGQPKDDLDLIDEPTDEQLATQEPLDPSEFDFEGGRQ